MKNYIKCLAGCLMLGMAVTACSDAPDELTDVAYDRLFSPVELGVQIRNQVNATVTWNKVNKATGYVVELYTGKVLGDTPFRTETVAENTIVFTELAGETDYFVRVKATGEGIPESKWVESTFKTDAENIFEAIRTEDLKATSVILRWPAGKEATTITVTPGDIVYNITAEDIAAGCAEITGLTGETQYTAVMKNGESTRGTVTFTTPIDLGDAVILYAGGTEEEMNAFFAGLEENASVCLLPDAEGNNVFPAMDITLTKSCSIMGLAAQPVVCGFAFSVEGAANVTIKDLTFNNTGAIESTSFIDVVSLAEGGNITIENCVLQASEYKNLLTEANASEVAAGKLTINNCIMTGMSGRGIDYQKKFVNFKEVSITNSTFYDMCGGQDFMRFDYTAGRTGAVYTISACTFYNVNASSKGIAYIRSNASGDKAFTCNFSKNLFVFETDAADVFFSEDSKTDNVLFSNNYYFNASSLIDSSITGGKVYDEAGTVLNASPFKDAASGDFTLVNDDLIYNGIGDPRWRQ